MITRTALIKQLRGIIKSDKKRWLDESFDRAIHQALIRLSIDRPLVKDGEITLKTGVKFYPVPDDFVNFISSDWGAVRVKQYQENYPGIAPRPYIDTLTTGRRLAFSSAPTTAIIATNGTSFAYRYSRLHQLTDENCTVYKTDEELLITACMVSLMKELVAANVSNPIQLTHGMKSIPNNSTPVVAHELLKKDYKDQLTELVYAY